MFRLFMIYSPLKISSRPEQRHLQIVSAVSRPGESPFMKVVNQVGDEVAVKDRDGSAFCVEAPPVRAG